MRSLTENKSGETMQIVEMPVCLKPIWEVEQSYRCPLIGSCLDADEHRRVLKKAGYQIKGLKLYEVHGYIMKHLHDRNRVSLKVDHYLKQKYHQLVATFGSSSEEELRNEWVSRLGAGGFAGLFYLICIRRDLRGTLAEEMFGELHMMAHAGVNGLSRKTAQIAHADRNLEKERKNAAAKKELIRGLRKENEELRRSLDSAHKNLALAAVKEPFSEGSDQQLANSAELDLLQVKLEKLTTEHDKLLHELEREKDEVARLSALLEDNQAFNRHLKKDFEALLSDVSLFNKPDLYMDSCPIPDRTLSSKRVLIVGGMTKIKHLYQHIIEMNGGQFEYHDGNLKNGSQNLDAKVNRSDLIICPVNCNSHNACSKVKKLCRKYKKPLKLLPKSSVNSISSALFHRGADLNADRLNL